MALFAVVPTMGQGCPSFEIQSPDKLVRSEEPFDVSVAVKGSVGTNNLQYEWTVSNARIERGQGSNAITVVAYHDFAGQSAQLKVTVKGLSQVCKNEFEAEAQIAPRTVCISPVDEFTTASFTEVRARVDNLMIRLSTDESSRSFTPIIELNFGIDEPSKDAIRRVDHLVNAIDRGKHDIGRVVFLISNDNSVKVTRFWFVPNSEVYEFWSQQGVIVNGREIKERLPEILKNKSK